MTAPLVSVCVPVFNGSKYLDACLSGIADQSFTDFEVLIVDDCSSDDGLSIARKWAARDSRFKLHVNAANLGLVENWNRCVALADGQWVKFLFQDDLIEKNCLAAMLAAGASGGGFVACARNVIYEGTVEAALRTWYEGHENALRGIYEGRARLTADDYSKAKLSALHINIVGEPSVTMMRRELFARFGLFDSSLVQLCDSDMWNRLASNVGIDHLPEKLVTFRVHSGSATRANQSRRFRAEALDEILEWTRLCRSPHLANFRRCARSTGQWRRLNWELVRRTNAAYEAARVAALSTPPDTALAHDIHAFLSKLPNHLTNRLFYALYTTRRMVRELKI